MADSMEEKGRIMEIEPAAEGPKVKPKRVLTEAQLEALNLGRSKLAEKRKMMAAAAAEPEAAEPEADATSTEVKKEVVPEEPEIGWAAALPAKQEPVPEPPKEESNHDSYQLCSIM